MLQVIYQLLNTYLIDGSILYMFFLYLNQISCPHTGADKIDRGGLEKLTLIEVSRHTALVHTLRFL